MVPPFLTFYSLLQLACRRLSDTSFLSSVHIWPSGFGAAGDSPQNAPSLWRIKVGSAILAGPDFRRMGQN